MGHTHLRHGRVRLGEHRGVRRIPLREAAEALGVSKDALRQRIRRGTIRSEKGEDGRVYVYLDASAYASADGVHDATADQPDRTAELIATLREQLAAERRANEENRRIIAALTQRIPELEAPREPPSEPSEPPTAA